MQRSFFDLKWKCSSGLNKRLHKLDVKQEFKPVSLRHYSAGWWMKQMLRSLHWLHFYPCSCYTKFPPGFLFSTWKKRSSCRQHNMVLNQEACLLTTSCSLARLRLQRSCKVNSERNRRVFPVKMRPQPKIHNEWRIRRNMTISLTSNTQLSF